MDRWDELRTALYVARLGTVSATAEALGVHRATIVRHIDALERELGTTLFHRHAQGYTPTEAGRDLTRVVGASEEQFSDLAARTRGRAADVEGELVVTSIELLAPVLLPALQAFQDQHPHTTIRYEASERLFRLEYGEAHVAVRLGPRPAHPDNVVRSFGQLDSALYAHRSYVARHGVPASPHDVAGHRYIADAAEGSTGVTTRWLRAYAPNARVSVSAASERVRTAALLQGMGIGFLPVSVATRHTDLVQVAMPTPAWSVSAWLVTHVDLHRTAKVQAALAVLRDLGQAGIDPHA